MNTNIDSRTLADTRREALESLGRDFDQVWHELDYESALRNGFARLCAYLYAYIAYNPKPGVSDESLELAQSPNASIALYAAREYFHEVTSTIADSILGQLTEDPQLSVDDLLHDLVSDDERMLDFDHNAIIHLGAPGCRQWPTLWNTYDIVVEEVTALLEASEVQL